MQIAMLIAGTCSRALGRSLSDHLAACDRCREIFAEAVKAHRPAAVIPCAGEDPPNAIVNGDNALVEEVLEGISDKLRATVGRGPLRRIIPLEFGPAEDARPVLAAKEPVRQAEAPLAVCRSDDGQYEVCFYRAGDRGGYRAVVEHSLRTGQVPARLSFPSLGLSFALDADGATERLALEGVLLENCRVDIEVDEMADPDSDAKPRGRGPSRND